MTTKLSSFMVRTAGANGIATLNTAVNFTDNVSAGNIYSNSTIVSRSITSNTLTSNVVTSNIINSNTLAVSSNLTSQGNLFIQGSLNYQGTTVNLTTLASTGKAIAMSIVFGG